MIRHAAALCLLAAPAVFHAGCDSLDCEQVRRTICERACECELCQFNFPGSGAFLLNGVDDCMNVLAENACSDATETEDLERCTAAVDKSPEGCPYEVPEACTVDGAFQNE